MSDEIIDVNAEQIPDVPQESKTEDGRIIPDPTVVEAGLSPEGASAIEERRQFVSELPEYPKEWQEESAEEDTTGFGDKVKVTATLKEDEMKKLIKKYKRYMKNNITAVKRLES